jgi:uncharacterized protein
MSPTPKKKKPAGKKPAKRPTHNKSAKKTNAPKKPRAAPSTKKTSTPATPDFTVEEEHPRVATEHLPRSTHQVTRVTPGDDSPPRKKSAKRTPLRVGGHRVAKGTQENIMLKISEHYTHQGVYVPVTVIRGAKAGPRLFITAAVHGDEVNGVQIAREVIDLVEPQQLRGTLVVVPVVNRFGFVSHSRYMPDRRDLNRSFPGSPEGSTSARVAHIIFDEIVQKCDYGIDLHTAGYQRTNLPQVRGAMDDDGVRKIAKAFGAEVIVDTKGLRGTLRRAATDQGVPTIIYEAGETFRFQRDMISKGVTGVINVLRRLKMVPGKPIPPDYQIIVRTSEWVRADHGGILETLVTAGHLVYKDDVIARIANPFGRTVDEVRAPFDGLVVGAAMLPMVNPGAPICHLVKLKKTLSTVQDHHDRFTPPPLPKQLLEEHFEPEEGKGSIEEEDIEGE